MRDLSLALTGIGLKPLHVRELLDSPQPIGFVEAHSENYFGGGANKKTICEISELYPVTLHGVGLSLGRADGLDQQHIRQIKSLSDSINPVFVSEHLTWSAYSHSHVPDLLPIPFTNEALAIFSDHVNEFQDKIGRQILIENPSNYLAFANLDYSEPQFLNELAERTGCGLLLDINNIAVSAQNLGYDAKSYIQDIAADGRVQPQREPGQHHDAGHHGVDVEDPFGLVDQVAHAHGRA
ncbi:DUF692 domain-containing protein, partial [bacterium]|nr:DUF692 domain-containing protein [bacterium]